MQLWFAGIVTTNRIVTAYEKRHALAQPTGCSEPGDDVSVACREPVAPGR